MPKDEQETSGPQIKFVWDIPRGAARATQGTAGRRRVLRRRAVLIGSGVLVLLAAGAAYGAGALSPQQQHATTAGAAAMTLPNSLLPAQGGFSGLPTDPSPHPSASASRSATAKKSQATTAAARKDAAAAQAPGSAPTTYASSSAVPRASSAAVAPAVARTTAAAPVTTKATPAPTPVGDWLLNQTVGNVAVDSTGAHDGTAEDGWWTGNGNGCLFNGTNSQIYTDGPVLSTGSGKSFTVSAWVDMTALPASGQYDETAVSQDGGEDSGFYLQYTEPADRWAFSRVATNTENPTAYRALSASAPSLSTWTHLVGVYDAANHTQYLYVNGVAQGTATDPTPFGSSGDLAIGRAQFNGQDTDWLKGAIRKVEVFSTALDSAQVSALS